MLLMLDMYINFFIMELCSNFMAIGEIKKSIHSMKLLYASQFHEDTMAWKTITGLMAVCEGMHRPLVDSTNKRPLTEVSYLR